MWVYARNMSVALTLLVEEEKLPYSLNLYVSGAESCATELRRALPEHLHDMIHFLGGNFPSRRLGFIGDLRLNFPGTELIHGLCNTVPVFGGVPKVLTLHDLYQGYPFNPASSWYARLRAFWYQGMIWMYLRRAARVITVHPHVARDVVQRYPWASSPAVIYSGLDRFFIETPLPQADSAGEYVLILASQDPRKNLVRMIEAVNILAESQICRLKIVANSLETENWVRSHLSQKAAPQAEILRAVPAQSMPGLYHNARGVLFASCAEGFGFPLYEALSQGVAVVCPQSLLLSELGKDAEALIFSCDPLSVSSIVSAARQMLVSSIDAATRQRIAVRVRGLLAPQRIARELLSIYAEVLGI